jgi:hypothetical protein
MGAVNWNAMQAAESTVDGKKERRPVNDVNLRQMSMGSWHGSLSKGGAPNGKLGRNHTAGGGAAPAQKGKR